MSKFNNAMLSSFVITILCNLICLFLFGDNVGAIVGFAVSLGVLIIRLRMIDIKYGNRL